MVRIAGIQMASTNVRENEAKIVNALKKAAADKVDILVTPEGALSNDTPKFDGKEVAEAVERVRAKARELKVAMALGTCYKETIDGKEVSYNQVRVYNAEGEFLGAHNKILRTSSTKAPGTGQMAAFQGGPLQIFTIKGLRFGCLICNNLWASPGWTTIPNPYLAWKLKELGAQFILHSVDSGPNLDFKAYHESNVQLHAKAQDLHIVEVNSANLEKPINARSGLVGPKGTWLLSVPDVGEQYFTCEFEVAQAAPVEGRAKESKSA